MSQRLHYLTDYSLASYSDYFWPRRAGLIPHLAGGAVALTAGLVQLWLGLTNRVGAVHRALGKVYAAGVLTGTTSCAAGSTCRKIRWPTTLIRSWPGPAGPYRF